VETAKAKSITQSREVADRETMQNEPTKTGAEVTMDSAAKRI
jgi:hypothetical protein